MHSFLDKILVRKKGELSAMRERAGSFKKRDSPRRPFIKSLDRLPCLTVIAEVKKASPSKGLIRSDFDPVAIAQEYERGGAGAVSVLTDQNFFQGHIGHLAAVREAVAVPVLRKDFIIDTLQVEETAHHNADAMLLIAEALDASQLRDLYQAALELDLDPLIELHAADQLEKVMKLGPEAVGINNRDLFTFKTDLGVTVELIKHIPKEVTVIAESGICGRTDAVLLRDAGVRALLVGESLMRAKDLKGLIKELQL
ncbi:MAG: indole-3-glycerol phosphate synthase TrpC [Chitinispirillaceae bacterium]|nr:indole-3-glycerol phosphate synthase TrpC [Chitinispirillaceae bacterium]